MLKIKNKMLAITFTDHIHSVYSFENKQASYLALAELFL